jgi:hypothetical protein
MQEYLPIYTMRFPKLSQHLLAAIPIHRGHPRSDPNAP